MHKKYEKTIMQYLKSDYEFLQNPPCNAKTYPPDFSELHTCTLTSSHCSSSSSTSFPLNLTFLPTELPFSPSATPSAATPSSGTVPTHVPGKVSSAMLTALPPYAFPPTTSQVIFPPTHSVTLPNSAISVYEGTPSPVTSPRIWAPVRNSSGYSCRIISFLARYRRDSSC